RSLRRHHNYRLFFAGQVVSLAGTWMQNVALAWLVLELSGSPLAVGGLAFARFLPFMLLGLIAGVVTDRVDTRRLVIGAQAASMVVSVALAVVTLCGLATLPLIYVLATLGGIALVADAPGRQALTFQMVGPRELGNAVALNSSLFNASRVIGPAIAGVLIAAVGTGWCFAVNAVSFLAVLAALLAMRPEELVEVEKDPDATFVGGVRDGFRWVAGDHTARTVLVVVTVLSALGFNFHVLVPLLGSTALDVGPRGFGLLSTAFGLGALAGALLAASSREPSHRRFVAGAGVFGALLLALAPVESTPVALGLLAGLGVAFTLLTTAANALVQLAAPDRLRGRVVAIYPFAFAGLTPVGGLVAGWLAEVGGTPLAFGVAGGGALAVTAWAARVLGRGAAVAAA
ncbi:MAG: MFS transporter, partial [Gaiella sp.]